jgi:hypothetical protein
MKVHITFDEELNCVVGRFEGDLTLDTAKEYASQVSAFATNQTCRLFLNDLREANIILSIFEIYELVGLIITEGFGRQWRRAVLLAPTTNLDKDKQDFFETVAFNRAVTAKMFTDIDKAIQWLTTRSDAKTDP